MKKLLKMGLLGLVIGAGAAFATATVGGEEAVAAVCCTKCEEAEELCLAGCTTSTCDTNCVNTWRPCYRTCTFNC